MVTQIDKPYQYDTNVCIILPTVQRMILYSCGALNHFLCIVIVLHIGFHKSKAMFGVAPGYTKLHFGIIMLEVKIEYIIIHISQQRDCCWLITVRRRGTTIQNFTERTMSGLGSARVNLNIKIYMFELNQTIIFYYETKCPRLHRMYQMQQPHKNVYLPPKYKIVYFLVCRASKKIWTHFPREICKPMLSYSPSWAMGMNTSYKQLIQSFSMWK